jgi:hypothetical protein
MAKNVIVVAFFDPKPSLKQLVTVSPRLPVADSLNL